MCSFLPPPVNPTCVWAASPGPLTTHPMIDNVMGGYSPIPEKRLQERMLEISLN